MQKCWLSYNVAYIYKLNGLRLFCSVESETFSFLRSSCLYATHMENIHTFGLRIREKVEAFKLQSEAYVGFAGC